MALSEIEVKRGNISNLIYKLKINKSLDPDGIQTSVLKKLKKLLIFGVKYYLFDLVCLKICKFNLTFKITDVPMFFLKREDSGARKLQPC